MAKEKREHPVVDGHTTTFKALGKALGITGSAAAAKYQRIKGSYGTVSMNAMIEPYTSPKVTAARQEALIQREIDEILRHARLHGATHAAYMHHMEVDVVRGLLDTANRKLAQATQAGIARWTNPINSA